MKKTIIAIVFVILLCACNSGPDQLEIVNEKLELAYQYISEQNYEQAILVYNEIIEIDPKSVTAYIGLAGVYTEMGDTEKAEEILQAGYEATESEEIKSRIDEYIAENSHEGNNESAAEISKNNIEEEKSAQEVSQENVIYDLILQDQVSSDLPGFIDIVGGEVKIVGTDFYGEIRLRDLPMKLPVNNPDLEINDMEYEYVITINTVEKTYKIGITKFKFCAVPMESEILSVSQCDIWEIKSDGGGTRVRGAWAEIENSTIILNGSL